MSLALVTEVVKNEGSRLLFYDYIGYCFRKKIKRSGKLKLLLLGCI